LRADTDTGLLSDAIFGTIYYRLLLRLGPLTRQIGEELVEQVLRGHRAGPAQLDRRRWPAPSLARWACVL
jgi:hypothetical protein